MFYKRIYDNIIQTAQLRNWTRKTAPEYVEQHHIIPRSLNGTDDLTNLVFLTSKEHFICHWLLYKIETGPNKAKMANAWFRMCQSNEFQSRYTSKQYSRARQAFSDNNPFKSVEVIAIVKERMTTNNPMKNPEISAKVSKKLKGKMIGEKNGFYNQKHSAKTLEKISGVNHYTQKEGYVAPVVSLETRQKRSLAKKGKPNPVIAQINRDKASTWKITTPSGQEFIIKNLNEWATNQQISPHWLYRNRHGYKAVKL